jgi:hypothetical protein
VLALGKWDGFTNQITQSAVVADIHILADLIGWISQSNTIILNIQPAKKFPALQSSRQQ